MRSHSFSFNFSFLAPPDFSIYFHFKGWLLIWIISIWNTHLSAWNHWNNIFCKAEATFKNGETISSGFTWLIKRKKFRWFDYSWVFMHSSAEWRLFLLSQKCSWLSQNGKNIQTIDHHDASTESSSLFRREKKDLKSHKNLAAHFVAILVLCTRAAHTVCRYLKYVYSSVPMYKWVAVTPLKSVAPPQPPLPNLTNKTLHFFAHPMMLLVMGKVQIQNNICDLSWSCDLFS